MRLKIKEPRPGVLVIRRGRLFDAVGPVLSAGFLVYWSWTVLDRPGSWEAIWPAIRETAARGTMGWVFLAAPVLFTFIALRSLLRSVRQRELELDATERVIRRRGKRLAEFRDVSGVTIEEPRLGDYRMSIELAQGKSVPVIRDRDRDQLQQAADRVAGMIGVSVQQL